MNIRVNQNGPFSGADELPVRINGDRAEIVLGIDEFGVEHIRSVPIEKLAAELAEAELAERRRAAGAQRRTARILRGRR